jgi:hypothetical protein
VISEAVDLSLKLKETDKPSQKGPETAIVLGAGTGTGAGSGLVKASGDGGGIPWSVSVLREAIARNMLTAEVQWPLLFDVFFSHSFYLSYSTQLLLCLRSYLSFSSPSHKQANAQPVIQRLF